MTRIVLANIYTQNYKKLWLLYIVKIDWIEKKTLISFIMKISIFTRTKIKRLSKLF